MKKIIVNIMIASIICNNFSTVGGTSFASEVTETKNKTVSDTTETSVNSTETSTDTELQDEETLSTTQTQEQNSESQTVTTEVTTEVKTEKDETQSTEQEISQEEELLTVEETITFQQKASAILPDDIDALEAGSQTTYNISTYEDVLSLQALSQQSSLEGYTFLFGKLNNTTNVWDLTTVAGFEGLGSEDFPFKGTIQEYYASGTTFKMNKPLFSYLGSGASVINFTINLSNATSGIARNYILTDNSPIVYSNVTLAGTISNFNGSAGALYGVVQNNGDEIREITIENTGIDVKGLTVTGTIAGGYIGETKGAVKLKVSSGANVAKSVTSATGGTAAGGIVGKLGAGSSFEVASEVTINNTVSGTGSVGGLIGVCESANITSTGKVIKETDLAGTINAGGYVGLVSDNSTISISNFILKGMVRANSINNCYAGGVIGQYCGDSGSLTISKIGVDSKRIGAGYTDARGNSCGAGGVIGYLNGSNALISDISFDDSEGYAFLPNLQCHGWAPDASLASSATGGIAGRIAGQNIVIQNIRLSFVNGRGLSGYRVGCIAGSMEVASKAKIDNVTIGANYISNSPAYNGGIAGYVDKGCVVALCNTIDLSKISYANDRTGVYGTNKGYVAGGQTESIIYIEENATLLKNEKAGDVDNAIWLADCYNYNTWYTIDDIGTYGGVYRNIKDEDGTLVIQYDNPYGEEITGTVEYTDEKYQMDDIADAMRLAIALGTFDATDAEYKLRFGQTCFQTDADDTVTGKELLDAAYCVNADLNLSEAGIFSLSRSDSVNYVFTGSMEGKQKEDGTYPVISLHTVSKQMNGGLFTNIKDATFMNLKLSGMLYYTKNFGGLATYAEGNVTIKNVDTDMKMRTSSNSNSVTANAMYYYGGFIGKYSLKQDNFICSDCEIAPSIENIRIQHVAGGMVGYIYTGEESVTSENIEITDVVVKSKMVAGALYAYNMANSYVEQARIAGMISYIGYNENYNLSNAWAALGGSYKDATYAKMKLANIRIEDASVDMSQVSPNAAYIRATGGLLGYNWNNVEVQVTKSDNSIDDAAIRVKDSQIQSLGRVGGLVTSLAGSIDFEGKTLLDSMTMTNCSSDKWKFSSFLIGDGRYAVVTLTEEDYIIDNDSVKAENYLNFDEIVGVNYALANNQINNNYCDVNGNYSGGGIVNIIKTEFSSMTNDTYQSYQNKVVTQNNKYTRYYYNLFGPDYEAEKIDVTTAIIDSPEKLMLWHLYKYVNANIKRFITPYFVDGSGNITSADGVTTWNFSGTLDMDGYSFYPTQVSGGIYKGSPDTILKLYGEEIENKEKTATLEANQKIPSSAQKQHYMMHAALFYNSSSVTVNNLTLKGTATNLGTSSGVLFAGSVNGTSNIENITCQGIRLANYTANDEAAIGLLVGQVLDGATLNMNGIETKEYDNNTYAAAALIGTVGSATAKDVHVSFKNMKVEDEKANKVFGYATFIYSYDSVDNSDINKSFGLYTFTEDDFDNSNVTFGEELGKGVHYYDKEQDEDLLAICNNATIYHPYVYKVKDILVNPRSGNLTKGCGTYEDPYIITDARQFLTLYCYLTDSASYKDIFSVEGNVWKVNPIGGGSTDRRCNETDDAPHVAVEYGAPGFPTRDDLRKAYYRIEEDLDLSAASDLNEYVMASDFSGLGTRAYPFSGVIVGKMSGENGVPTEPTITLPNIKSNNQRNWEYYGLIQYMKGAVVKNLKIQVAQTTITNEETGDESKEDTIIGINQSGGGVAAVVLGGDNIIDNVTVDIRFKVKNDTTKTGGYVGYIKKGSVIVRNMENADIKGYQVQCGDEMIASSEKQQTYKRNGRVIGWVEDGCVLYEDTDNTTDIDVTSKTLEQTDFEFDNTDILLSYSFPIVNGNYLAKECESSCIKVTGSSTDGFYITMDNAAQVEIAALALNSDAFSIYNSGSNNSNHTNGYDDTAVCRKAQYNALGSKDETAGSDYLLATTQDDNKSYYPYLYKYMDFTGITVTDGAADYSATQITDDTTGKRYSLLNWPDGTTTYGGIKGSVVTTYQLVTGNPYDLSDFGRSFRGFGALYNTAYSLFKANFDGQNASVTANMVRDWDSSITTTGLFNNLTTYKAEGFTIENVKIVDSHFENLLAATTSATGSVAGYAKGVWNFNNIQLVRSGTTEVTGEDVSGNSYTGGLIGCIRYYSTNQNEKSLQNIQFTDCKVQGKDNKLVSIKGVGQVGGLLGYVEGSQNNSTTYFGTISFENCGVEYCSVTPLDGKSGNVGGFIGRVGWCYNSAFSTASGCSKGNLIIKQTTLDNTVSNTTLKSAFTGNANAVGGLIGLYSSYSTDNPLQVSGISIEKLQAESLTADHTYYGVGGLFGGIWSYATDIQDVKVKNSIIGKDANKEQLSNHRLAAGGIIGSLFAEKATFSNIKVAEGTEIGSYGKYAGGFVGDCKANNLVIQAGDSTQATDVDNSVKNTTIQSGANAAGGVIGNTSQAKSRWDISSVNVQDVVVKASMSNGAAGGIIGKSGENSAGVKNIKLSCITVGSSSKETEISGTYAGGLIGYIPTGSADNDTVILSDYIYVGCSLQGDLVTQDTKSTNIFGKRYAGGLFGFVDTWGKEQSSADIQIQNTKIGAYADSGSIANAGGIAGYRNMHTSIVTYDSLLVKDCLIVAANENKDNIQIACGGLYGQIGHSSNNFNYSSARFYNPKLLNNSIGYAAGLTSMDSLKALSTTSKDVHLLINNATGIQDHKHWGELNISKDNIGQYSMRIGNFVGIWNLTNQSKHLYVLRPELTYDNNFAGSRPAIDIGNAGAGTQNDMVSYGYGYPYAWRQFCHIVYFEPKETPKAEEIITDTTLLQNSENEYLYDAIDDKVVSYDNGTAVRESYLNNYRLNVQIDSDNAALDYYEKCYKENLNGVKVVNADGGTAQAILDSMVGIMTNMGGISSDPSTTAMKNLLNVSAKKAKITTDGKIVSDTGMPSLEVVNNKITYRELIYDDMYDDGSYSITLLSFRYGWLGADGKNRYETIYVPVYVVERIAFYNDLHIMEGEQYSLADAHDSSISYSGEVTVAHDSTYTLFSELAYGKGRTNNAYKNYVVEKTITFEKVKEQSASGEYTWEPATIPEGMQFTLIDVQSGTPYYYKIPEGGVSDIDFTAFKDETGNAYSNRKISEIKTETTSYQYGDIDLNGYDFGLEQFFIYVDSSNVEEMENNIFKISITTDETESAALSFFDRTESDGIQVTWKSGLNISFYNKENKEGTYIAGEISKDGKIQIDTSIQIKADDTYWNEKAAAEATGNAYIDSENNNKYLDIAIYLNDRNAGSYVALPNNTNIIVNGQRVAVVDKSVIYGYKDWESVFPIGAVKENIIGETDILLDDGTTTVNNECHIELDFSAADIDAYIGKDYDIYIELRRTSNPEYPLGGDTLDEYSETIKCIGSKEMAVALNVEELMNLGINTYHEATSDYEIPFTTKLDFANMIGSNKETDIDLCAGKKYLVTYRLKKKVKSADDTYQYNSVGLSDSTSQLELENELKLSLANSDSESLNMITYNGEQVYQIVKTFTADEIKKGEDGIPYIVSWDVLLNVDTENINTIDFSNYMVEVTVLPYDAASSTPPEDDKAATLIDYFIFTIGKLKTDM